MEWPITASQVSAIQLAAFALSAIVTVDVVRRFIFNRNKRNGQPLPPGPILLPLLGSVAFINAQEPWLTYTEWWKKYGNIIYTRLLDLDVVVLNSHSDTLELLDKRSEIYSDRPFFTTVGPFGYTDSLEFARYGPRWKSTRRIIHQTFHEAAHVLRPMQLRRARQVVINIMDDPSEFQSYYATYSAGLAMSAIYDYEPKVRGDPIVGLINDFLEASAPAMSPLVVFLLKAFPFLLSVPEWIPGLSRIRCEANKSHALGIKAFETPYKTVQKRIAAKEDVVPDTMVFNHIRRMEKLDSSQRAEYEKSLKSASMSAFIGATDAIVATLMSFTLAMVKNPRVWKRAQAEIDAVIGKDRLPEFEDRPSLPYIEAILRETWRWIPVAPLGAPHVVTADDIFKGYLIPRGTIMVPNLWAMSRDEARYPDPEAFTPERFLNSDGTLKEDNPIDFVFGFGKRICPGINAADASVWSGIVTLLATLDFNAIKDEHGNVVPFETKFVEGLTRYPVSFPCNLAPRAHMAKEVLQRSLAK